MSSPKNIVLYIVSMHRGGAERVMSILANHFADKKYNVTLVTDIPVTNDKDNYFISANVNLVCIKPQSKNFFIKNFQRIKSLRKIIKKEKPDTVLSFLGKQNVRMLLATIGLRCRKCVSVRNDPNIEYGKSRLKKWITNKIFSYADICVFQTEDAKKYFNKKIQSKSVIIPNPIDEKFFNTKRSKNPKNIIAVGRLEPQKNHKLLIDAFALIADKIPDENLLIYGTGSLKKDLQEHIENLNLQSRVFLKGESEHIEKELAESRLFVLSSDYEGMPNALMEAMAVGLPCISTDCPCGGPKELFSSRDQKALVSCNNKKQLSLAIESFFNGNTLRKNNINHYQERIILEKWDDIL